MAILTPADVQEAQGAERMTAPVRQCGPRLKRLFADGAYDRGHERGG